MKLTDQEMTVTVNLVCYLQTPRGEGAPRDRATRGSTRVGRQREYTVVGPRALIVAPAGRNRSGGVDSLMR